MAQFTLLTMLQCNLIGPCTTKKSLVSPDPLLGLGTETIVASFLWLLSPATPKSMRRYNLSYHIMAEWSAVFASLLEGSDNRSIQWIMEVCAIVFIFFPCCSTPKLELLKIHPSKVLCFVQVTLSFDIHNL